MGANRGTGQELTSHLTDETTLRRHFSFLILFLLADNIIPGLPVRLSSDCYAGPDHPDNALARRRRRVHDGRRTHRGCVPGHVRAGF